MTLNFFKYRRIAFFFSMILIISSVFLFLKTKLNLGIDFKGGHNDYINFGKSPNLSDLRIN